MKKWRQQKGYLSEMKQRELSKLKNDEVIVIKTIDNATSIQWKYTSKSRLSHQQQNTVKHFKMSKRA